MTMPSTPVSLYYENAVQTKQDFEAAVQESLNLLSRRLELGRLYDRTTEDVPNHSIVLLFTNDTEHAARAVRDSRTRPEHVILLGYPTSEDFLGYLERTGMAGLVTSSALDKWRCLRTRPGRPVIPRATLDYGLYGRKEAFDPAVFAQEDFDVYRRPHHGFFHARDPRDDLNLEDTLHHFVRQWQAVHWSTPENWTG